jgi:outer membrane biosynthesis protein TonB/predicted Ser/Thr protein kinase
MNCPSCRADNDTGARSCFACGAPLDPVLASLSEGAVFASRYEILGPLGRGGMGMVYKAFDRELGETVAIKVLRPDVARESGRVEQRFRSEIRLARRVRHRNVCSVYGDGEDRGLLYICMEHVEGENLARAARESGGLPTEAAWSATLQVAEGLRAIHEVGVVHRDLKTANLMRDQKGIVRVMDFGIAKQHGAPGGVTVTATGTLMGTPEYMSPEQLRGDDVDFRTDLYSLGVVTYELFTGTLPFQGDTPVATIVRQLHDAPFLDVPTLPGPLRPVLARALAKDPVDRYAGADDMRRALEGACEAHAPMAMAPGAPPPPPVEDDTRPVTLGADRESPPIVRMAVAQAALALLAVYLVSAGGVVPPPKAVLATPEPVVTVVAPTKLTTPALKPTSRPAPVVHMIAQATAAATPTPVPTHQPGFPPSSLAAAIGKTLPAVVAPLDPQVYQEHEVDLPPRRISGTSASYPDWGPRLGKGQQVSITASFVVNEAGDVTDIRVERGGGVLEAVLLEISRWKYEPGRKNGQPVKVRVAWQHTFIGG